MDLKVACLQINTRMGDVAGNLKKLEEGYCRVAASNAHVAVGSELLLTDYPAIDLYMNPCVLRAQDNALDRIRVFVGETALVVTVATKNMGRGKPLFNTIVVIHNHEIVYQQHKTCLADQCEFSEWRQFEPNPSPVEAFVLSFQDGASARCAVLACEDVWGGPVPGGSGTIHKREPVAEVAALNVEYLFVPNGSPGWVDKPLLRDDLLTSIAQRTRAIVVYANKVGGTDNLVFDGDSSIYSPNGRVAGGLLFKEGIVTNYGYGCATPDLLPVQSSTQYLYEMLVLSLRDYVHKNGFLGGIVASSGGIDSAVTLALLVEALGAEQVHALMLPSPISSEHSVTDAEELALNLGIRNDRIDIAPALQAFEQLLAPFFVGHPIDVTEENIQARVRGLLVMAFSNKFGILPIATGNKSEMSVGYCTLYGDMCGGFAVLNDVYKTWVFRLANHINSHAGREIIPLNIIRKKPSAELSVNQFDTDTLPPYDVLDAILQCLIEDQMSAEGAIAAGHDPATVHRIEGMLHRAEYKRRQAPPGPKVTRRGLTADQGRMVPITFNRSDV